VAGSGAKHREENEVEFSRIVAFSDGVFAIVLMPFSSQILGDHGGAEAAVVLYAANLVGVILSGSLLFAYAHRSGLTRTPPEEVRANRRRALTIAAFFLISIPVAFVDPTLAPYCWLALFVSGTAGRLARRRKHPA
jgi:uncharacterized membrane protein